MQTNQKRYWFPAKRYGWGWGFPITWQGWVVFLISLGLIVGGPFIFGNNPCAIICFTLIVTGALFVVCWFKGERPHWRWGKD